MYGSIDSFIDFVICRVVGVQQSFPYLLAAAAAAGHAGARDGGGSGDEGRSPAAAAVDGAARPAAGAGRIGLSERRGHDSQNGSGEWIILLIFTRFKVISRMPMKT